MLSSFTRASAKFRHGAGLRSGLQGLECFTKRIDGVRSLSYVRQWHQPSSATLGSGLRWTGQVETRIQARWFIATPRSYTSQKDERDSRSDHPLQHRSLPLITNNQHSPSTPTKAKLTGPLREALPKAITKAKHTLHENIYTLPNFLTFSRLIAAPFIGYCILHDYHTTALALFAYAGLTDALDGWIARRWNLKTVVGTVIDPMADKTLMTVLTVALAMKGALPLWLAVIILGRDVALAISAVYYRWISLPPPKTFARYWDFSLPSAEVRPTMISKVNTALQLGLMGLTTLAPVVPGVEMAGVLGVMQ